MNVEFNNHKSDLIGSPIKESIKEQLSEDDEEDAKADFPDLKFEKHKTCEPKPIDWFDGNPLFWLNNQNNDLNLDALDKHCASDFPMDIDDGIGPWNSLNFMPGAKELRPWEGAKEKHVYYECRERAFLWPFLIANVEGIVP